MKSPWVWIAGIIAIVWIFSGQKNSNPIARNELRPYYQPTQTYQPPIPVYKSFSGYPCTVDCSGHEAGYAWAEENSIDDPDDCSGTSDSFIEGCQAYAEEQQAVTTDGIDDD